MLSTIDRVAWNRSMERSAEAARPPCITTYAVDLHVVVSIVDAPVVGLCSGRSAGCHGNHDALADRPLSMPCPLIVSQLQDITGPRKQTKQIIQVSVRTPIHPSTHPTKRVSLNCMCDIFPGMRFHMLAQPHPQGWYGRHDWSEVLVRGELRRHLLVAVHGCPERKGHRFFPSLQVTVMIALQVTDGDDWVGGVSFFIFCDFWVLRTYALAWFVCSVLYVSLL